jgi:hypothetical protein
MLRKENPKRRPVRVDWPEGPERQPVREARKGGKPRFDPEEKGPQGTGSERFGQNNSNLVFSGGFGRRRADRN